ncbi:F-box/LRR-repeat protein 12 isoform X1 [Alosa alosa]|uniref:F-box/LRR-repeat protein 12 isoform X1 n=1 Tax=Alosa sapidissima TaxID=34773 RepID=UPI001C0947B7|nr:F-box/LRR-repeat protein 12 isoform X1 [Alosa sapidissima]XP_048084538.1 F-box/LRR-repeat protein 12 isoform X1 [Alosa alosa]
MLLIDCHMAVFRLPEEIWMEVFKYLSKSDKLNVRSCCTYFKRLVDHRSLWKNETIALRTFKSYKANFWKTLRCRMLASVIVDDANEKEWKKIVTSLPWLRSVIVDLSKVDSDVLTNLSSLRELKTLVVRLLCDSSGLAKSLTLLPQLEQLSVCCFIFDSVRSELMNAISQLSNLTSLRLHEGRYPIPKQTFHALLRSLPKLKHLSLRMWTGQALPDDYLNLSGEALGSPDLHNGKNGLTSLELLNYMDPMLSPVALDHLPFLESLTVKYDRRDKGRSHLRSWLKSLTHLTELTVMNGHPFRGYATSLPRTLRTLSLTGMMMRPGAMALAAKKVPDLQHLHYDPFDFKGDIIIVEIPRLFPQLQTLKIRSFGMSGRDLLRLGEMHQMKRLVFLDGRSSHSPISSELLCRFQVLTDYRVHVVLSGEPTDKAACLCDFL